MCCSFKGSLGFVDFYKNEEEKNKEESQDVSYNLGNGLQESSTKKANRAFLEREFEPILSGQDEAIFVPNCFIPSRADLFEVDLEKTENLTDYQALEIEKNKVHIKGDRAEYWMYHMIRDFFHGPGKTKNKDILVFHGWKSNWLKKGSKKAEGDEFDFIIISNHDKLIMNIEVKNTLSKTSIMKLCQQLPKRAKFFLNRFNQCPENLDWKYVKVAASPSISDGILESICDKCQNFLITKETEFSEFWNTIQMLSHQDQDETTRKATKDEDTKDAEVSKDFYIVIAQDMLGVHHAKEFFNTPFLLNKKLEEIQIGESSGLSAGMSNNLSRQACIGSLRNMLFWSPLQKAIFEDPENLKVLFGLHFGGGKSTMMKEKAIELAKEGKEVFYICMNGCDSNETKEDSFPRHQLTQQSDENVTLVTLFELITRKELGRFGIRVINLLSTDVINSMPKCTEMKDCMLSREELLLMKFIKLNQDGNFFIDDFYFRRTRNPLFSPNKVDESEECLTFAAKICGGYLWVALNYESIHNADVRCDPWVVQKWSENLKKHYRVVDPSGVKNINYRSGPNIKTLTNSSKLCTQTEYERTLILNC